MMSSSADVLPNGNGSDRKLRGRKKKSLQKMALEKQKSSAGSEDRLGLPRENSAASVSRCVFLPGPRRDDATTN